MEKSEVKVICTIKEVQRLVDVRNTKANKMIQLCRAALAKKVDVPLYIDEFKEYFEL
jgi:hypothetical protein